MIPRPSITFWSNKHPWPSEDQVEQDLALSRLIIEIASHPVLRDELVFRGGTCLHKLHLPEPLRYSEDLDYVRTTHGPIGPVLDALREVADDLGMEARTEIGPFPKVFLRAEFESGSGRMRITVEMNTYETSPARPHVRLPFAIESPWWSGSVNVLTFEPAELVATKLRALYQRRKGRDLFDLWLALVHMRLDADEILECFVPYRPEGYTADTAIANLREHLGNQLFRRDLDPLVASSSSGAMGVGRMGVPPMGGADDRPAIRFDIAEAGELVIGELLRRVD